jgi:hypothetical protein
MLTAFRRFDAAAPAQNKLEEYDSVAGTYTAA